MYSQSVIENKRLHRNSFLYMSVLIRQARVVDPQSDIHDQVVDILIEDGKIKAIDKSIDAKADKIIEEKELYISRGWVDIFADYREPGYEHKETINTGLACAAAGGFTTVLLAPNTNPVVSNKSTVQYVLEKANTSAVKVHPLGAITQDAEGKSLAEMLDMHAHGAIAFTDGWKPVQNTGLMLKALEYAKSFDGVLLQIPLDASLSAGGLMHEGDVSTRLGMAGIPVLAETVLIHRDIELLRYTGSKLHITGVSTAAGLKMIREAKAEGLNITCSVTPYHLALTHEALQGYDSVYKVTPVLRSEEDRQALIKGLKDGAIDCIVSHHRPQEWDAKAKEFEYAGDGMGIQEIVFGVIMNAIGAEVPLPRIVDALAIKPREIFGLPKAEISYGKQAELTIFTTAESWTFSEEQVQSQSKNNPFIGTTLKGKVLGIINKNKTHLNN